jgi:endonuclease IV
MQRMTKEQMRQARKNQSRASSPTSSEDEEGGKELHVRQKQALQLFTHNPYLVSL